MEFCGRCSDDLHPAVMAEISDDYFDYVTISEDYIKFRQVGTVDGHHVN